MSDHSEPLPAQPSGADPSPGAPGLFELQAGRRLFLAMLAAGLFAVLACTAFYLFEVDRLVSNQLASLAHQLGQVIDSAGGGPPSTNRRHTWQLEENHGQLRRDPVPPAGPGQSAVLRLDNAWLAAHAQPGVRLFLVWRGSVRASSLGDAGAGEASAIDPAAVGRIIRNGRLFVQAPIRWDDGPDSPLLIAQQPLALPFSLGEIAAAGLFLWGILAGLIWLTVGIWLNKALHQIQYLAYHDPLTGLINRAALRVGLPHMLAECRRNDTLLAVLYLDLDRFKTINDSLGHAVGDQVLKACAGRLLACIRDTDFVARLGGDEFIVVIGELRDANDAAVIARKIIDELSQPVRLDAHSLQTGASIGIATYPGSAATPDALIKQADSAMYAAKQLGRGRCHFYDESLGARADRRLTLELQLRRGLANNEFELYYQPIVSGPGAPRLCGFEALLRWRHGDGFVEPGDFIPLAEETGLIVSLGDWVLQQACHQLRRWQTSYPDMAERSVSVNVSVRQLHAGDFASRVAKALAESGLAPSSLILELTESLYVDRHTAIPETLRDLRRMGVRLAMDDFGTGYSSLANLSRLPLDRLKIDRAFINNICNVTEELAIAKTIIAIGKELGLEVVAEGIETGEQAVMLARHGCHLQQGWLFGKALPAAIAEQLLEPGATNRWSRHQCEAGPA